METIENRAILDAYIEDILVLCPNLTASDIEKLLTYVQVLRLNHKEYYLSAGTHQTHAAYVYGGLLRCYYLDEQGNEITFNFVKEKNYAVDYMALVEKRPSKFYFQALEPTIIINIKKEILHEPLEENPLLERYIRLILENTLFTQLRRLEGFLFGNAEKRYLDFVEGNSDLFHRVSLSYLCSYLGMERQTITRIRKKLAKK